MLSSSGHANLLHPTLLLVGLPPVTESWFAIVPAVLAALVILLVPGAVLAVVGGARRITALGLAPVLSASGIAIAIGVCSLLHIRWGVLPVLAVLLVLVALVGVVRIVLHRRAPRGADVTPDSPRMVLAYIGGVVGAAVILGARLVSVFGHPNSFAQAFDNVFHLNAISYIVTTGDVDPRTFGQLTHAFDGQGGLYPDLWHGIGALMVETSSASVPVVANALNLSIGAVVWPLSMLFLVRQLFGKRLSPLLIGAVLCTGFAGFPLLMLDWGPVYPLAFSLALVPAAIGLVVIGFRRAVAPTIPAGAAWILVLATLPGIVLAHPSSFMALLLYVGSLWIAWEVALLIRLRRRRARAGRVIGALLGIVGAIVFAVVALVAIRPPRSAASWVPTTSYRGALKMVVTSSQGDAPWAIVLSVLFLLGAVAVFVARRHRWLAFSLAFAEIVYIVTVAQHVGELRFLITGIWYSDQYRTIALVAVIGVPLATIGTVWVVDLIRGAAHLRITSGGMSPGWRRSARATVAVVVVALVAVAVNFSPGMTAFTAQAQKHYQLTTNARLVDTDEYRLIERVDEYVPKGQVIAGNPWNGSSLVWALAGRRALFPHIYGQRDRSEQTIIDDLRYVGQKPGVCAAVKKNDVRWVLDFGNLGVFLQPVPLPGFQDLSTAPGLTLVAQQGPDRLYKITACGLG